MTRERIAGFLVGVGIGTALGFFLQAEEEKSRRRPLAGEKAAEGNSFGRSNGRLASIDTPPEFDIDVPSATLAN
jgi:hypothetical protein